MERRAGATQAMIAVLLVALSGGALLVGPVGPTESNAATGPEFDAFVERPDGPTVDREVEVVASLEPGAAVPEVVRERRSVTVAGSGADRRLEGTVALSEVRALSDARGVTAVQIDTDDVAVDGRNDGTAPGAAVVGATDLHRRGITGEDVTVGVIDDGFRLSHPAIADQVAAYRAFGGAGDGTHGTVVAGVVADTAPGSRLHLAAVGPTTTPEEYRRAVRWLRVSGADVIVDSGSYLGATSDGEIVRVAEQAADDVAFVTSAGNYANRHWTGVHRSKAADDPVVRRGSSLDREDPTRGTGAWGAVPQSEFPLVGGSQADATARGWVRFGDSRRNYLGDGPIAGQVTVTATWNTSVDYDIYLVRETASGDVVWTSARGNDGGHEQLSAVVPRGRYAVVVGHEDEVPRPTRLRLFADRRLSDSVAAGSLTAPATGDGVVAVGALGDDGDGAAAFSSRGPVDGEAGVSVVAPDSVGVEETAAGGTSFAAPYVAGTVALLQSEHPDVPATRVAEVVQTSARDVGRAGVDPATGHGRLDAVAAERALEAVTAVDTRVRNAESDAPDGERVSAAGTPLRPA